MNNFLIGAAVAAPLIIGSIIPACAAGDMKGMKATTPMGAQQQMMATDYKFEIAGTPKSVGGKSTVSIRLVHGGKPVKGAIIIQSRADMGPIGMAAMTAPIKPLGEQPPGIYSFEIDNGSVWKKPDNWALSFSAKVQGVAQTVTGSVIVKLNP